MNSAPSSIHLAVHKRRDILIVSDTSVKRTRAVLSQGGPRDAAVNFDKKIYNGIARFLCHGTAFLYSPINDRSNNDITHSTLIFTAVA